MITPVRHQIDEEVRKNSYSQEGSILDIGAGDGKYSKLFKVGYHGIDSNPKSKIVDKSNALDLGKWKYDLILSITCLEHIRNHRKAISEMRRVMKKGAYAVVIVPSRIYWLWQFGRHCHHHYTKREFLGLFGKFKVLEYKRIGGLFSTMFGMMQIWLSQAIALPFWLLGRRHPQVLVPLPNRLIGFLDRMVPWLSCHQMAVVRK